MIVDEIVGHRFAAVDNDHGLSGADTVFEYRRDGDLIVGEYSGGVVRCGQIVGYAVEPDRIVLRFQCLTVDGELRSGRSRGRVSHTRDGRLQIDFDWAWLDSTASAEQSRHEEI